MAAWRMGYPSGLDGIGTYEAGMGLYDPFGVVPITLDSTKMCRAVAQVLSVSGTTLTCENITNYPGLTDATLAQAIIADAFEISEFNGGYVRFLSGDLTDSDQIQVYKIVDTDVSTLDLDTALASVDVAGEYIECVTGSCTYTFPDGRNPTRRDLKRVLQAEIIRFPYYEGGLAIPISYENDDFVISCYVISQIEFDRLQVFLAHMLDYKGFDAFASTGGSMDNDNGIAPIILETGHNDILNQYLGVVNDFKFIKDAKRGDTFWELLIHMYNYSKITYRGL